MFRVRYWALLLRGGAQEIIWQHPCKVALLSAGGHNAQSKKR